MATCKIGKFKFSLHITNFHQKSGFQLFIRLFFVNKTVPTKAKANKSKALIVSLSSFCQDKSAKKLAVLKKLNTSFPSFVYFMESANGLQS